MCLRCGGGVEGSCAASRLRGERGQRGQGEARGEVAAAPRHRAQHAPHQPAPAQARALHLLH